MMMLMEIEFQTMQINARMDMGKMKDGYLTKLQTVMEMDAMTMKKTSMMIMI